MDEAMRALFAAGASNVTVNADGTYTHTFSFGPAIAPRVWADAPMATPLAAMRGLLHRVTVNIAGRIDSRYPLYMSPATYHAIRQAHAAAWWRALPRRDKQALRKRGLARG